MYFRHSDNENIDFSLVFCVFYAFQDAVRDSWLGLAGLPGRAGLARPSESSQVLKNLAKMARDFPGLDVFLYFLDIMNAKCTFLARKRVWNFWNKPPEQPPLSLFSARTPKRQALFAEKFNPYTPDIGTSNTMNT